MKWSKYNYFFNADSKYFLYNSLSNSFAELREDIYEKLHKLFINNSLEISDLDLKNHLINMKAFVEDDRDELCKIKYLKQRRRFNNTHLGLTINPTLQCNFACPYCFEGEHSNIYMTDEVENDIIKYISRHKSAKSLHVTWFGGEPLLAFNRIVSLTNKIKELNLDFRAGIISNGYLLNENIILQLESLFINKIQITIDGGEKLHDSRRYLKSGKGTFHQIIKNISLLQELAPNVKVVVRVNIDETNKHEYIKIVNFFKDKSYPNLVVSSGFVKNLSGCNPDDCIFDKKKKSEFVMDMHKKYGLEFPYFYPSSIRYECPVRNPNVISIGPSGEIYKCWNDVGNPERIIGNIKGNITNENLLIRYLNGSDPFEDEECKQCILLPVCDGGCPHLRIKRDYENTDCEICCLMKNNMNDFLLINYYNQLNKKKKL